MSKIEELAQIVENGEINLAASAVRACLEEGAAPMDILNAGMIAAMAVVGEKFKNHQIFVTEMLLAAKTMKKGVEVLRPYLSAGDEAYRGKMAIGTVRGDLHDIGKNLVIIMVEAAGYEVVDLGIDVPVKRFLEAAADPDVVLVGVSALLTTTMPAMQETVAALNECPRRGAFKIMVGGAPVTREFADEIGADIYTEDAAAAGMAARDLRNAPETIFPRENPMTDRLCQDI